MKIVLVEDNPSLQKTMSMMLTRLSHSVKAFGSAKEALAHFNDETFSYDLVILDGNLAPSFLSTEKPMNGPDIAARLLIINKNTPIIAWTDDPRMLEQFQNIFHQHERGTIPTLDKKITLSNIKEALAPFIATFEALEDSPRTRARTI